MLTLRLTVQRVNKEAGQGQALRNKVIEVMLVTSLCT